MRRTKILVFVVSFLVLFLATPVAFANPVSAPPPVPTSYEEAVKGVATYAPETAPGTEIVAETPPSPLK